MFKNFTNANVRPNEICTNSLAFLGDAVFTQYVREKLILTSKEQAGKLHRKAVKYVSARSQAIIMDKLIEENFLTEDEMEAFKRGRNSNSATVPRNVDVQIYKIATGFESMVGYLYCEKNLDRIEEIFDKSSQIIEKELKI